jgi:AcrR family transcriptional regulator
MTSPPAPSEGDAVLEGVPDRAAERRHLLAAGWTVLRRNGYGDAGVAEILAEAKLGTRAFYRHFASKDELLVEVFRTNARVTEQQVAARVAAGATPADAVLAWIDAVLDLGYDPRQAEMAKMFASPIFTEAGEDVIAGLRRPLHDALLAGAASGELVGGDPETDAATIHSIVWTRFVDALSGSPALTRAEARRHVERFVVPALGLVASDE